MPNRVRPAVVKMPRLCSRFAKICCQCKRLYASTCCKCQSSRRKNRQCQQHQAGEILLVQGREGSVLHCSQRKECCRNVRRVRRERALCRFNGTFVALDPDSIYRHPVVRFSSGHPNSQPLCLPSTQRDTAKGLSAWHRLGAIPSSPIPMLIRANVIPSRHPYFTLAVVRKEIIR